MSVTDSGVGIAREDSQKLFKHFGKLGSTSDMNHEGIGLGLVIVKKIIEQVGGSIVIKSDGLGKGSAFEFIMPL